MDEFFAVVEQHARDGVDFMTIHCGMNQKTATRIKKKSPADQRGIPGRFPALCLDGDE